MKNKYLFLLCGLAVFSLTGCKANAEATVMDPTVIVEATAVQVGDLTSDSTYIGTISAEGTARVVSMVSGTVEQVHVAVGDIVAEGQALCKFDDTSARLTLDSARSSYSSAQAAYNSAQESYNSAVANYGGDGESLALIEAQVALALDHYESTKALFEMGAASQIELDQAALNAQSAQAGLQAAQSALSSAQSGTKQAQAGVSAAQVGVASAEYQLTLYNLTSPISGIIEAVNVSQNNFSPAGSVAFVISNAENRTVSFYVTDEVYRTLVQGQEVTVSVRDQSYTGHISEISGVVDVATGLFQVKALVNAAQDLPDGLKVEVTTTAHAASGAYIIPSDALYFDDGIAYVYLVEDDTAVRSDVNVILYTADFVAITSGVTAQSEVVTTWSSTLRDGSPIRIVSELQGESENSGEQSES